jgi:Na+/H+ antiporter NhaA
MTASTVSVVIAAVIFDLDGVLVDSEAVWDEARRALVAERGGTWRDEATRAMMGMSSLEWSRYVREELGVAMEPEAISAAVVAELERRYRTRLPLIDGARDAVERLAADWPLGLASSSNREIIDLVLDESGLADRFAATVSSEEVGAGKPAPDVYLEAARRLGVEPQRLRRRGGLVERPAQRRDRGHEADRHPARSIPARLRRARARRRRPRLDRGARRCDGGPADVSATTTTQSLSGRTAWARNVAAPVRDFLSTETGGAVVLLAATLAALIWANSPWSDSYDSVWHTELSIRLGDSGITMDLREWVNQGLMTFFFLVVGLEAKRELGQGQLRERPRLAALTLMALGGMGTAVAIYLAFNAGGSGADGWGAAMSTDTAFALGVLALVARGGTRLRVRVLTVAVVDDLVALVVIATAYTEHLSFKPLMVAVALFAGLLALRWAPLTWRTAAAVILGFGVWVALHESGIDPVVAGLAVGLVTSAYPPARTDLEQVTELTRSFREQPTPALARSAQLGVAWSISLNDRLQYRLHPWTSFVIVPLFALANAGVHIDAGLLGDAVTSPITLGIVVGYVVGKPVGILITAWISSRTLLRGLRLGISWPVITGGGVVAGVGFTVSLLISNIAFEGRDLEEAKIGVLAAALLASVGAWAAFRVIAHLPAPVRARPGQRDRGRRRRPLGRRGPCARPRARRPGRARHAGRVRRLPVPVLRPGGGRDPPAAELVRRRSALRVAPPAAQRRARERPARRRGRGGGRGAGRVLADARPAPGPSGCDRPTGPRPLRGGARARRGPVLGRPAPPRAHRAHRPGRRQRRRQRGGGDPELLHQRSAPQRRLRRRDAERGRPRGAQPRGGQAPGRAGDAGLRRVGSAIAAVAALRRDEDLRRGAGLRALERLADAVERDAVGDERVRTAADRGGGRAIRRKARERVREDRSSQPPRARGQGVLRPLRAAPARQRASRRGRPPVARRPDGSVDRATPSELAPTTFGEPFS